jgi:hypothetical protein
LLLTSALLYLAGRMEPQRRAGIIPGSVEKVTRNKILVIASRPSATQEIIWRMLWCAIMSSSSYKQNGIINISKGNLVYLSC